MPITREQLEDRKKQLQEGLAQMEMQLQLLKANFATTDGALQDVNYWLAEEEKSSSAPIDSIG